MSAASADYVIREGGVDDVERLEPLFLALRDHHVTLPDMPAGRPRPDAWAHRRAQYLAWLPRDRYTLLLAERDGVAIGYAVVSVSDEPPATWDAGERVAELETLSVLEGERGGGVGRALTAAAERTARAAGADAFAVGVAHTNDGAIRFYEREGYAPFYVLMLKV